jgi:PDZ domain-containing protein
MPGDRIGMGHDHLAGAPGESTIGPVAALSAAGPDRLAARPSGQEPAIDDATPVPGDDPTSEPVAGAPATWPEAGAPPAGPPPKRRRVWPTVLAGLVALVLVVGALVRLPYYILSPGEATPVEPLIHVQGAQSYQHDGSILFTTVALAGDVNAYAYIHGKLNHNDDVVSRDAITGGTPTKTYNAENVQAMTDSKTAATKVALERLGYQVPAHGEGALVVDVTAKGPADGKLQTGDVITAVDGKPIALSDDAVSAVQNHRPGDVITMTVARGGQTMTVPIKAGDDGKGVARIGVALQTKNLQYNFPVQVTIDTGKVAGPSAGLAFTLAILDDLTAGNLTGGKKVAVTGTIDVKGDVGPVGGVVQKTAAARKAGAVAFLVPPDEEKDAKAHAGPMKIMVVKTVDDALAALQQLGGSAPAKAAAPAPH